MSTLPALTLSNEFVRLELSSLEHVAGLQKATADGELWTLWYTAVPTVEGVAAEITRRLNLHEQGKMIPLTIIRTMNGVDEIVGMTSFMNIEQTASYKRGKMGPTWYSPPAQRTIHNTPVKHLMLKYAFEDWKVIAVEFRTHRLNTQSRRAIERLGAQLDGILRAHQIMHNGTLRDTAVYSITANEWSTIKTHLEFKIEQLRHA